MAARCSWDPAGPGRRPTVPTRIRRSRNSPPFAEAIVASQTRQILARWLLTGTCAGAAATGLFAQTAQQPPPAPPARGTAPARGAAPARGGAQASTSPTNYTILGCIAREGTSGAAAPGFTITGQPRVKGKLQR